MFDYSSYPAAKINCHSDLSFVASLSKNEGSPVLCWSCVYFYVFVGYKICVLATRLQTEFGYLNEDQHDFEWIRSQMIHSD